MIRVESLTGQPNLEAIQHAQQAFHQLAALAAEISTFSLGELHDKEVILNSRILNSRGYKKVPVITVLVNELIISNGAYKGSDCIASLTLAKQGATDAFLPKASVLREEIELEKPAVLAFKPQFAPEIALPLVNWLLQMKNEGNYINPPEFSLPEPN